MSAQLELDLKQPTPPPEPELRQRAAGWLRALCFWTPVWVPLCFLGQLLVLGLRPARAEAGRLGQAESEVRARVQALQQEERALAAEARMLTDGVYQERVRRSLVDPQAERLTLERARAGEQR